MKHNIILIIFYLFLSKKLASQTYLQIRFGYVEHQYKALNKNILDKNEHDYINGFMIDAELGKEFKKEKFSYLIGGRLQYNQQNLKGVYTHYEYNSNAKIKVHIPTIAITLGVRVKIYKRFSSLFKVNLGVKHTLWYQDNKLKETFWDEHIPINTVLEYKLKNNWRAGLGLSFNPPKVYVSQTYKYFVSLSKYL